MEFFEHPTVITLGLCLAVVRIFLETIQFDFAKLPLSSQLFSQQKAQEFHRWGFYLSVLYFITFAPGILLA